MSGCAPSIGKKFAVTSPPTARCGSPRPSTLNVKSPRPFPSPLAGVVTVTLDSARIAPAEGGHHEHEFGDVDWLGHVHLKARGQGPHSVLGPGVRSQGDRGDGSVLGWESTDLPNESVAVLLRHADVRDEDVW